MSHVTWFLESVRQRPISTAAAIVVPAQLTYWVASELIGHSTAIELWDVFSLIMGCAVANVFTWLAGARTPRQLLILAGATAWSLRLSWHLGRRAFRGFQDERLSGMRATRRGRLMWCFSQSAWILLSLLPVWAVCVRSKGVRPIRDIDRMLFASAAVFLVLESVADEQKAKFCRNRAGRKYCATGLFSVVRYPHYACEIGFWLCMTSAAFRSARPFHRFLLPLCPLFVYLILSQVSVPFGDAAVRKRTSLRQFMEYMKLPAFIPRSQNENDVRYQ